MLVPERKTEDGFEEHFGINYLGHFLLTNLLLETLKQSGTHNHNARIVTLSSATHYVGELHFSDLQSRYENYFTILTRLLCVYKNKNQYSKAYFTEQRNIMISVYIALSVFIMLLTHL